MVAPPRVLEINVISAHDLALVSKSMKTYATTWVDPERKLTTRVDQNGLNNPSWNEKFVFRVDDRFLTDETSAIMLEIFAAAWLKDALIGSVRVPISHLFDSFTSSSSATRYVELHVRRPSGRPQGIIHLGITLLDNKMRSMPLLAELCATGATFSDVLSDVNDHSTKPQRKLPKDDQYIEKDRHKDIKNAKLRRSQSDRTGLTSEDDAKQHHHTEALVCDSSSIETGSGAKGNGSVVNGSICSSDVGPSASVVAAAIAKGLYKTPVTPKTHAGDEGGNLIIEEWRANENGEDLKAKLDRWRTEPPPVYDNSKVKANSKHGGRARRRSDSGGLFSCFGNAFGCEITITCGGGNSKKRYQTGKVCHLSSVDGSYLSQSYV